MKIPLKTFGSSKSALYLGVDFFENNEKIIIDIEKFIIYYVIK